MPSGDSLTPKQERFAQIYVETGNASEAYRQAYDSKTTNPETIWPEASKVLASHKVATRVMELQQQLAERHQVTVDSITKEYEEARALAITEKQSAAAVSATTGKAKLHGLLTEKHTVAYRYEDALAALESIDELEQERDSDTSPVQG